MLKRRVPFNGEFAEKQTSHINMCAAQNFALMRSLRGSRTNCTFPKSEDLLMCNFTDG